jgi:hypothetical protein
MAPPTHHRRPGEEPRGFVQPAGARGDGRWRRALDWLFGDREELEQEGLLAERTLLLTRSRPPGEANGRTAAAPEPPSDGRP